ncbi:MAG: ribonuclease HI family protein [Acidobacteriota bacterium]|nr:ribonuclease HI family protein [Acidobacteriota bacterium]NLH69216.1 ribonuclease HI family protein [Brooklawnia sp.]
MITAAADGSSLSNPGPAGWAWYIDEDNWQAGGWPRGTNNMGELQAVLSLLRATESVAAEPLKVLCDSQYVINSVTKWMPGWKRQGWKKADGKPVLNQELLKSLDESLQGRDVSFEWVRGHAGHPLNEAADQRARAAATAYQDGTSVDHGPGFRAAASQPTPGQIAPEPSTEPGFPSTAAASDVDDDLLKLVDYEKELLSDRVRSDSGRVRELLHPQFTEFGASGRIWTRNRLLAEIRPMPMRVRYEAIGADRLADDLVLLRWRALSAHSEWLRSSIWQRTDGKWQLRFAQGTPVLKS